MQITFDMASTSKALACTLFFLHRFEGNLEGFHIINVSNVLGVCRGTHMQLEERWSKKFL